MVFPMGEWIKAAEAARRLRVKQATLCGPSPSHRRPPGEK